MKKTFRRLIDEYKQYKVRHKNDGKPKPPEEIPPLPADATNLKKIQTKIKIWKNKLRLYMATGTEQGNLFVIFLLALTHALAGVGHFIVLPIAIAASGLSSALYARHAYLSGRHDRGAIADAALNMTVSLILVAGIILTFIGTGALATIAPALITGAIGLKALYDLGAAVVCYIKYHKYKDTHPGKAESYYDQAKEYMVGFVTEALLAGAAAGVLLANKSAFGAMGIAAGVIGGAYATHKGYKTYKAYKAEVARAMAEEQRIAEFNPELALNNELTNNASLRQALGIGAEQSSAQQTQTVTVENTQQVEQSVLPQVAIQRSVANAPEIEVTEPVPMSHRP